MSPREGPPERERPWPPPQKPGSNQRNLTFQQQSYRPRRQQGWKYAQSWRAVYARGFLDALRLAERELPPETWATLQQLAERYDLAVAA